MLLVLRMALHLAVIQVSQCELKAVINVLFLISTSRNLFNLGTFAAISNLTTASTQSRMPLKYMEVLFLVILKEKFRKCFRLKRTTSLVLLMMINNSQRNFSVNMLSLFSINAHTHTPVHTLIH